MRAVRLISVRIGVAVAAMALVAAPAGADGYQMESSLVDTGFTYYYDLAVDTQGNAHAVYDETQLDCLYYNNNVGGVWGTPEFVHTTSDYGSTAVSGAVDSSGVAHVAYDSGMGGNDVFTYATNGSGSWASTVVRTTSRWYSLDLSPAGIPRVAYYYDYSGLNYATLTGTSWTHEVVDSTGGVGTYAGRYPDLVVDADDCGHIVYYNYTTDAIRYATNTSGAWQWEELVSAPDSNYAEIALEPEPNGRVLVAYRQNGRIWLARGQAGGWETVAVTEVGNFGYLDVKTDAAGRAYVVYNDSGANTLNLAVEASDSFVYYEIFDTQAGGSGPVLHIHDGMVHVLTWNQGANELFHLRGPLPFLKGDLNCDGEVDFNDINPFVLALSNPQEYELQFPGCPFENRDINGDGEFNFNDINPFVALLSGS